MGEIDRNRWSTLKQLSMQYTRQFRSDKPIPWTFMRKAGGDGDWQLDDKQSYRGEKAGLLTVKLGLRGAKDGWVTKIFHKSGRFGKNKT